MTSVTGKVQGRESDKQNVNVFNLADNTATKEYEGDSFVDQRDMQEIE